MSRTTTFDAFSAEELRLTADEYWFFRHNGFLRLREPMPSGALVSVRGVVEREIATGTPPLRLNDQGAIKRIDRLVDRDPAVLESTSAAARSGSSAAAHASARRARCTPWPRAARDLPAVEQPTVGLGQAALARGVNGG